MATYIIGDVQGCYQSLQKLLEAIRFDPTTDRLGFVGDLVNRGPQSLQTLRFIHSLKDPLIVLGNHDLYFLAIYYGVVPPKDHTLSELLEADDCDQLAQWLMKFPLLQQVADTVLVHAGIPPQWSIINAQNYANDFAEAIQSNPKQLFTNMMGNQPDHFSIELNQYDRLRYIMNAFTRMRFCDVFGKLDLSNRTAETNNPIYKPWFEWRKNDPQTICFGHWAALQGQCDKANYYALDTGCVWGNQLTALRLDDKKLFSVNAEEK